MDNKDTQYHPRIQVLLDVGIAAELQKPLERLNEYLSNVTQQNNILQYTIDRITNYYDVDELAEIAEEKYGLSAREAIEMSYDNIMNEAKRAKQLLKELDSKQP